MERLEKDGKVAVLISRGYGAGWSTWNSQYKKEMLFDKEIAEMLLTGNPDYAKMEEVAEEKYLDAYLGGLRDLVVEWVPKGEKFSVQEYDGHEYIVLASELEHET